MILAVHYAPRAVTRMQDVRQQMEENVSLLELLTLKTGTEHLQRESWIT